MEYWSSCSISHQGVHIAPPPTLELTSNAPIPTPIIKKEIPLKKFCFSVYRLGMQASRMFSAGQSLQQSSTLSHIESQLAACLLLKSAPEYKFWLQTYTRYLSQEGECPLYTQSVSGVHLTLHCMLWLHHILLDVFLVLHTKGEKKNIW